jgi:hypothetical protein
MNMAGTPGKSVTRCLSIRAKASSAWKRRMRTCRFPYRQALFIVVIPKEWDRGRATSVTSDAFVPWARAALTALE